jgi:hypothetical protein
MRLRSDTRDHTGESGKYVDSLHSSAKPSIASVDRSTQYWRTYIGRYVSHWLTGSHTSVIGKQIVLQLATEGPEHQSAVVGIYNAVAISVPFRIGRPKGRGHQIAVR